MVLLLTLTGAGQAQEALRYSLAGQDMAEARKRALENEKFSVEMGPVSLRFTGGLGLEGTDNVRYREDNREADLIIRPQVNALSKWRVSERNSLSLGLGMGYEKYINATDYDRFFITPDTDLSFDLYVGDFLINFHDQFDYTADVSDLSTVSGTGSLPRFENTIGIRTVWDLNKAFISAGYDHQNYIATESEYDYLTHSSELFTAAVGFQLRPTIQAGLQMGGGLLDYTKPQYSLVQDNQHVSVGLFANVQLSEYSSFRLSGGYVTYHLDSRVITVNNAPVTLAADTLDAVYVDASFRQRVSGLLTHSLSFGRSLQPQFGSSRGSQLLELYYVYYWATWNVFRKTGLTTSLTYDHGNQPGAFEDFFDFGETYNRYGARISLSRIVAKNTTATLSYQFYLKDSDRPGSSYVQNRLVLNVVYAF